MLFETTQCGKMLKNELTQINFREINSLVTSLVKRWFDGENVDLAIKMVIVFLRTILHCVRLYIFAKIDFT